MYTNKPIRIHTKCLCLLELIQEAGNRVERAKGLLHEWEHARHFDMVRLVYNRNELATQPQRWQRVKDRLVSSYERLKAQL